MDIFQHSFNLVTSKFPDYFTLRQLAFLGVLYSRSDPSYVKELADLLKISKPVVTRMTNKFITEGFVERSSDPNDGRGCVIDITPSGRAFVKSIKLLATLNELKNETKVFVQHV